MEDIFFYESDTDDPYYNLALEEYLFNKLNEDSNLIMLWQNKATVVVGKYQNTAEEINAEYIEKNNINVVRRLSGGGAVYHDKGNLNFTYITNVNKDNFFNFELFAKPIIATLEGFGIKAEFNGRNDIIINQKKVSGSSQYIDKGRLLHHGCIMLDVNLSDVSKALNVKDVKIKSKSIKSVRSRITTIKESCNLPISMESLKRGIKEKFLQTNNMKTLELSESDKKEITKLRDEKYNSWEWNYGNSPNYSAKKEKKFDFGIVNVHLLSEKGLIKSIKFYGDFFGNGDIRELETSLIGEPISKGLLNYLKEQDVGHYIQGINAEEIYKLIAY